MDKLKEATKAYERATEEYASAADNSQHAREAVKAMREAANMLWLTAGVLRGIENGN